MVSSGRPCATSHGVTGRTRPLERRRFAAQTAPVVLISSIHTPGVNPAAMISTMRSRQRTSNCPASVEASSGFATSGLGAIPIVGRNRGAGFTASVHPHDPQYVTATGARGASGVTTAATCSLRSVSRNAWRQFGQIGPPTGFTLTAPDTPASLPDARAPTPPPASAGTSGSTTATPALRTLRWSGPGSHRSRTGRVRRSRLGSAQPPACNARI